ncbi:amidohydrolase family protein [Mycobacteroides immunogenum]|uniref:amidohydrolase n=1 Tax=Mycobacteroides immunogenum TaxID=83262 RepID=UPI0025B79C03|nr:amidohydrolase family protein [Mycobacteroides immunogenum]WJR36355.1 amidohydrolase family protein [Mycobacteroides immunogenum]
MAVTGGVISWIGDDDLGRTEFPDADIVDLEGAFVAPAFVDAHVHVTALGLSIIGLDLSGMTSREQCLARLTAYAGEHDDTVIWGHGWDESQWPDRHPLFTADLDAAVPGRAVYLSRIDVHSAAVSTALRRRVPGLAEASGFHPEHPLAGAAHHVTRSYARGALTVNARARARRAALDRAASLGLVSVHECGGPEIGGLEDFRELLATEHGVQVTGYWGEAARDPGHARQLIAETGAAGLAGDLFVDGALGSRTAWLREPYHDAPDTCGIRHLDAETVETHLDSCTQAGITAGFHVIGDAAVAQVIDALGRVAERHGVPAVARCGHRLEHLEMVSAAQAEQLGRLGVIASVQPAFDALWGGPDGMYAERLGVHRGAQLNPLALLASQGVPLAFGSDAPVTPIDPWATVRAAAYHRSASSSVSVRAAFSAATRGGWRAQGIHDGATGTLTPGAPASYAIWETGDLTINTSQPGVQRWSTDPRSRVPALPDLSDSAAALPKCLRTVHRGKVIHG